MAIELPDLVQQAIDQASPVADIGAAVDEAQDILADDEWDYAWRIGRMPISLILAKAPFDSSIVLPGENAADEAERLQNVRGWMASRGGAEAALAENPVLVVVDSQGAFLLDGWHRIVIALEHGLSEVNAAIGLSTTPLAAARAELFADRGLVTCTPGL